MALVCQPITGIGRSESRSENYNKIQSGMEGLPYEMIINSNPSIAYLMLENPMSTHLLTMSHCVGHSDFFKNNRMFKHTDPDNVIARFKAAGKRVQQYIEDPNIGIDKVERILDACHAIQYQIPRTPGITRLSEDQVKRDLFKKTEGKLDLSVGLVQKDYNLLGFIRKNARDLEDWQRDLEMVERRSKYFVPQGQTKIMNEGWAVLIQKICMT